ncbi:MAG: hypothetical protein ACREQV_21615 [Candidatus Binatia bacterium]
MIIESLKLIVTEGDLNELASRVLPQLDKLDDLRISLISQRIRVTGTYRAAIGIPFETVWEVSVCEGKLGARLLTLKTGFLSLGLAKEYALKAIAAAARMLELRGDMLLLDADLLLREKGLPVRTNFTSVRCDYGSLILESG